MAPRRDVGPSHPGRAPARSGVREERFALAALAAIAVITAAWWALALWPLPAGRSDWLLRTRAVCFGSTETGLPDAEGWALLVGQPLGMTLVLLAGWRRAAAAALRRLARSPGGRLTLAGAAAGLLLGATGATVRVADASAAARVRLAAPALTPAEHPDLDRPAPTALALVDHRGGTFSLDALRGRPALVTFAFAHCETVCPVLVREVLDAQREAPAELRPAAVVVTVDPWRDTPARLEHVAHEWGLDHDAHVLGGDIPAVLAELEAWDVEIRRDSLTGDVTHPALVYVLDRQGRIAFATTGAGEHAIDLIRRLD